MPTPARRYVYRVGTASPPLIVRNHPRDPAAFAAFHEIADRLGAEVDALVEAPMPFRAPEPTGRCLVCGDTLPARSTGRPALYCQTLACRAVARDRQEEAAAEREAEEARRLDRRVRLVNEWLPTVGGRGLRLPSEVARVDSARAGALRLDPVPGTIAGEDLGWSDGEPELWTVLDGRVRL